MKSKQIIILLIVFAIMVSCGKQVEQKLIQQKTSIIEKKDTFNLCYMTCSFEDQLIYEQQILEVRKICDGNFIECKFLLQNQKIVFQIYLKKPSQYWYLQNMNKLRIGLKIITIVESKNTHNKIIKDTDLIYWSNYVDLRNYKIAPRINIKDVVITDSLDNDINNYIEYPYYIYD